MRITAPGVHHGMPIETYHSDCCDGPSISSSGLRTILLECPARYWATSPMNPDRVRKDSEAFSFGRAAHALALGEPDFARDFVVSPYPDFRTKEAREWRDAETRTVITASQLDTIKAMVAAIRANPLTARAFKAGQPELSMFWRDEPTGVWLKSRPDFVPTDPAQFYIQEYKTAASADPRKFSTAAFGYGYDMQAALVLDGWAATHNGEAPLGIAHIVQEKDAPYLTQFYLFAPDQIEIGRRRIRKALDVFARCWERHQEGKPAFTAWPPYSDAPQYFVTPKWLTEDPNHTQTEGDDSEPSPDYAAAG